MDDKKDPFNDLEWETEIVRLTDLYIPFNPLSECRMSGAKPYWDDYKMTPFLQST